MKIDVINRCVPTVLAVASFCLLSTPGMACVKPTPQSPSNKFAMARIQNQFQRMKAAQRAIAQQGETPEANAPATMVGMWLTTFSSEGEIVDMGFDVWHSDGTQILNDSMAPAAGAVCLGIWKQTGDFTYELKHPTWAFDETNENLIGVGYILEKVTLDSSGKFYKGTYSIEGFDLEGKHVFHFGGEISGERVTMDPPHGAGQSSR